MLNIVLVEPEIPQNTGNIARTCAVTGSRLHLVHPFGFRITDAKLKRAGLDYWHQLNIVEHDDFDSVARIAQSSGHRMFLATTKALKNYTDTAYQDGDYLVFGKETAGLGDRVLSKYPDFHIRIPMRPTLRSLNLSNAVAIVAYEALRQLGFPGMN